MRRIKFLLLLGGVGFFYLSVTLLALILGLIIEARNTFRAYFTATGIALTLLAVWAALVQVIA